MVGFFHGGEGLVNVLAHVHKMIPVHHSGAEYYLYELLDYLRSQGHAVQVAARDVSESYTHLGVPVHQGKDLPTLHDLYAWADVILTHLDLTRGAVIEARKVKKPVIHLIHNERQLKFWAVYPRDAAVVVFNSEWLRRKVEDDDRRFVQSSMVCQPLVHEASYRTVTDGRALTLINLSENKGSPLVWELARRLPDREFIGVIGSYHEQLLPPRDLTNVEVVPTGEILPVYQRTGILLMPSRYESWGRTALEAGASGIPTIAHPTPGLLECLGAGGLFTDRENADAWETWIARLDDPEFRQLMSDAAWEQTKRQERRTLAQLEALDAKMRTL